jgi:hypothetical protein
MYKYYFIGKNEAQDSLWSFSKIINEIELGWFIIGKICWCLAATLSFADIHGVYASLTLV